MKISKRKISFLIIILIIIAIGAYICWQLFALPTQGKRIANHALEHVDAPYVFGKTGPDKFDCSGFLVHCFGEEGISLPHSALDIGTNEDFPLITEIKDLRVGDILFFDTVKDRDPSDHLGIYLGDNTFIHCSSATKKVTVSEIKNYYQRKYMGARRVAGVSISIADRFSQLIDSFKSTDTPEQENEA